MRRFWIAVSLLIALGAGVTAWQYRAELAHARARLQAESSVLDTACGPIEYAERGAGRVVLLVHGSGGGYDQMQGFAEALADAGFRAIAMSRFGYLRTPMPEAPSPETQADAHACLLDRLGVTAAVAFGASAGAPSAMQFCLRHRSRCSGLVLLVPVAFAEGRSAEDTVPPSPFMGFVLRHVLSSDFVIWAITRAAPGMLVETVLATPKSEFVQADSAEKARALGIIRGIFPVTPKLEGIAHDSALGPVVPRYALEDISTPTLVISVENDLYDTYAGALYTAAHIPHARLVGFPSGGHGWLGHHREVLETIIGFLREQPE